jgi:hypothetical protein
LSGGSHVALVYGLEAWWKADPFEEPEQITYLDLTDDTTDKDEPDKDKPEPEREKERLKKPRPLEKPDLEFEELPEPEDEEEEKPEPEEEPPPPEEEKPPVDFVLEQLKMVEQPDELDEQDPVEDANYLSNINRDVQQETRAKVTNLQTDAIKPEQQQIEPSPETEEGTANSDQIAQREQLESQLNKQAPDMKPQEKVEQEEQNDKPQSLLAMRELEHRDHQMPQEMNEALAAEADDGSLRPDLEQTASIEAQRQQARVDKNDKRTRFKLAQKDLDALYGKTIDARKRADAQKQSKTKGVWTAQRDHWQSPLENMVPEVQVGNQTALRSRKHPFARYIAQMHRKIHEAWAWGFLEQLDTRGRQHPLNDYDLWTRLELVINSDGTIDKVTTVHYSGKIAFDAAAREVVWSTGPYPNPPKEIISGNGKVYIHWAFHRDERACGTFGAQPFILDSAGIGDRPDPDVKVRAGRGGEQLGRRLGRGKGAGAAAKPTAPAVAEGPALPPGARTGEHGGHDHAHEGSGGGQSPLASASPEDLASDPAAKKTANEWLAYFNKGRIDKVAARSSLPFYSGDSPIARTRQELKDVLITMKSEAKGKKPKAAKVFTAAGLRKVFGSVPGGVQEGSSRVYALTKIGGDYVVLLLEKKFGSWRVVGITR